MMDAKKSSHKNPLDKNHPASTLVPLFYPLLFEVTSVPAPLLEQATAWVWLV